MIKVALPKGGLLAETAALLEEAGWGLEGYNHKLPLYHIKSLKLSNLSVKVFHEKDIPIQVAIGNYDLGICGLDWLEELHSKYPSSGVVRVKDLGFGDKSLFMLAAGEKLAPGCVRIASEYPNLAERYALKSRFSRFAVFPVWGGAEAYPPENAELALVSGKSEADMTEGMVIVGRVLDSTACLIANRQSWQSRDLYDIISTIPSRSASRARMVNTTIAVAANGQCQPTNDTLRLALPDGHQQQPAVEVLNKAGIGIEDYPSPTGNRRPRVAIDGVTAKVIRPQDMPMQVANGNFDLAITGRDWLREHLFQFPSSPVKEIVDLKFGWVKLVAVVSKGLAADDVVGLRRLSCVRPLPLRVASEYTNIADKYARDNHLGPYRVIPTWGATEAFLPDDADMLIENTQTGGTIARHHLKIIDTLFESTACLIVNTVSLANDRKGPTIEKLAEAMRSAVK